MLFPFQNPVYPPLELLSLHAVLEPAGFDVKIIDERIEGKKAFAKALNEAQDALLAGISCRPGRQVRKALELASAIKNRKQDIPIVLGGWFPSVLPETCVMHKNIDYVISGAGERSVLQLAKLLAQTEGDQPSESRITVIPNLWSKNGNRIRQPKAKNFPDISETPPMPYSAINLSQYLGPEKEINYLSSRGCPRPCNFCAIQAVYPGQWTGLPAKRIADETEILAAQFGVKTVRFTDMDFFVDPARVRSFAEELEKRPVKMNWRAAGHVRHLDRFRPQEWKRFFAAGLRDVETGGETAAEGLNLKLRKDSPQDLIKKQLSGLTAAGITPHVNFMFGSPDESAAQFQTTIRFLDEINRSWPQTNFVFYRFSPIPGTSAGEKAYSYGVSRPDPENLHRFSMYVKNDKMEWLSPEREKNVKRAFFLYLPLLFSKSEKVRKIPGMNVLKKIARYRLYSQNGTSGFAPEWRLFSLLTRVRVLNRWRLYSWK